MEASIAYSYPYLTFIGSFLILGALVYGFLCWTGKIIDKAIDRDFDENGHP